MNDVPLDLPINTLLSYFYYRNVDIAAMDGWGLRIIADSGAYSAMTQGSPVILDEYAEWLHKWGSRFQWAASLDVIGDAEASWDNWQALNAMGLVTVPTVHYGEPPAGMDRYVEQGATLIGLGGMVGGGQGEPRLMRWAISMMRYARRWHPEVRFHGWGCTKRRMLFHLPWWSTDSSSFASVFRYGTLALFDPDTALSHNVAMNGRDIAAYRVLLDKHYGLNDWRRVAVSTAETRRDVTRVAMRAVQLTENHLRERHHVTPPPFITERAGPEISMVLGFPNAQPARSLDPDDDQRPGPHLYIAPGGDSKFPANPRTGPEISMVVGPPGTPQYSSVQPADVYERLNS